MSCMMPWPSISPITSSPPLLAWRYVTFTFTADRLSLRKYHSDGFAASARAIAAVSADEIAIVDARVSSCPGRPRSEGSAAAEPRGVMLLTRAGASIESSLRRRVFFFVKEPSRPAASTPPGSAPSIESVRRRDGDEVATVCRRFPDGELG